jgi:hypothetical protein
MSVVVILPCRGRKEQTLNVVQRLLATSGLPHHVEWKLVLVSGSDDADVVQDIAKETKVFGLVSERNRLSYWEALQLATDEYPADLYACVANDVLPCVNWLVVAIQKFQETFTDGLGMVGFNGDGHNENHSCHFLISSSLLKLLGGWPIWYHHNFGDTEIVTRARQMGRYVKSHWSILFHDHPWISAKTDDEVYAQGRSQSGADSLLFDYRRKNGWIS